MSHPIYSLSCAFCGASGVRIYMQSGTRADSDFFKCKGCIATMPARTQRDMVPCIPDEYGEIWNAGCASTRDRELFNGLRDTAA